MFSRWCPHSAAAPGMQRKVIYCCTKTWANQKVKFITKDNSCFHNSRSLSQKLRCVCSLGSRQENKTKLCREGLAFAAIPRWCQDLGFTFTTFTFTASTFTLFPSHLRHQFSNTPHPHWAQQKTKSFSPQSLHDLHC